MLKSIELSGFKSFAKKTHMHFPARISAIVGPNGSGKSNAAEAFRFALGEQSMKSLRGSRSDDLLWNGSDQHPRANRAGVKITFDNSEKRLDVDFDEVAVERIMHRDSSHQYYLNGSQVRLKDIMETLASANIGATGHHIISQGEADRILLVKPAERKHILEDALGLKIYHYKKDESTKKLAKTHDNLQEILNLQREIEPELKNLSRQMTRIEKARTIREETQEKARIYFASREFHITTSLQSLTKEAQAKEKEREELKVKESSYAVSSDEKANEELVRLRSSRQELEGEKRDVITERRELERAIGRLEGRLIALSEATEEEGNISFSRLRTLRGDILGALEEDDAGAKIRALFDVCMSGGTQINTKEKEEELEQEINEKRKEEDALAQKEAEYIEKISDLEGSIEEISGQQQRSSSEILDVRDQIRACTSRLEEMERKKKEYLEESEEIKEEVAELGIIFGPQIAGYKELLSNAGFSPLSPEEEREFHRDIERGRIKIEDADLSEAQGVEHAYKEIRERNDFLQKEVDDLRSTRSSLEELINELEGELNQKFKEGIEHINKEFSHFFSLLFGGGGAELSVVTEEKQDGSEEEGVEIDIELPRKRIKGLAMLSGGERTLTSIALVFSISRINPPPFLILDETDAALDEANSRKYGDMIENLSEQSQLILITHNRETMSRAGLLYGVTMGADGISRLLSVKFEDAKELAAR